MPATTEKKSGSKSQAQRPVHEIRLGKIRAAIWANTLESGGIRHNVTFARLYRDGETWKDSASFGRDDMLLVMKVADMAHSWIYEHGNDNPNANSPESF